jgi:hypothetical protein
MSLSGLVFNYKLGHFIVTKIMQGANAQALLKLKTLSTFGPANDRTQVCLRATINLTVGCRLTCQSHKPLFQRHNKLECLSLTSLFNLV